MRTALKRTKVKKFHQNGKMVVDVETLQCFFFFFFSSSVNKSLKLLIAALAFLLTTSTSESLSLEENNNLGSKAVRGFETFED